MDRKGQHGTYSILLLSSVSLAVMFVPFVLIHIEEGAPGLTEVVLVVAGLLLGGFGINYVLNHITEI